MRHVYASVRLARRSLDALRNATVDLTSQAGRRLTMSEVLMAALTVACTHRDELLAALRESAEV